MADFEPVAAAPEKHPRGPEEHKAAARKLGLPNVRKIQVLAPQNDPFYKGTATDLRDGHWFAEMWQRFGYTRGVHLRRVHYQVLSTDSLTSNGKPYENTLNCWKGLCDAASAARVLGLVDAEAFVDRRNPDPAINRWPRGTAAEPSWSWSWGTPRADWSMPVVEPAALFPVDPWLLPWAPTWRLPTIEWSPPDWSGLRPLPDRPDIDVEGYDYDPDDQPVVLEVWVEKSTMEDILGPLCRSLNVNLVTGVGNQSITAAIALLRRAERHGKPAHVLYVSDFDPAGEHMPVAVARQAQFWAGELKIDAPLTLDPLVLTREQVDRYALPRVPIKDEDRRKANFEEIYGAGAVELDALEALHPGVFRSIVRDAVQPYIDRSLSTELDEVEREAIELVNDQWADDNAELVEDVAEAERDVRQALREHDEWLDAARAELADDLRPEGDELAGLSTELRDALAVALESFRPRLDALAARVNAKLDRHRQAITGRADELTSTLAGLEDRIGDLSAEAERIVEDFDPDLPGRPLPADPEVDRALLLYDSRRHWLVQLDAYRRAKGGGGDG